MQPNKFILPLLIVLALLLTACDSVATPTPPPFLPEETFIAPTVVPATPTVIGLLPTNTPAEIVRTPLQQGFGAQKGFWQVYFTAPTGSRSASTYVGGIDTQLADAIRATQRTLDIAAFEFNNVVLTEAVLDAQARGVTVRMVTDDEHGLNDEDATIGQLVAAGIPVIADSRPSALMHNKFMILDGTTVWMGSWNYTVNDTYRNNNNALALRSRRVVELYQAEFDKMFAGQFGTSKAPTPLGTNTFTQNGARMQVFFAPEDRVVSAISIALSAAQRSIRFMAFSLTQDEIGGVLQQKAQEGVAVQGIFESTGSETANAELKPLFCLGLDVRQDGNSFALHHKVFIIDDRVVITGSFNFSQGARDENDENLLIISDSDLAAQYNEEFNRRYAQARVPTRLTCS